MSQRGLLTAGIVGIVASLALGVAGVASSVGLPMMGWLNKSGGGSISMDQAQQSIQSFVNRTGDGDLKIDELMEFQQNFYALIKEQSTGIGAFELVVNKGNGVVAPEPGPNMMWNTKYSMMGSGVMGGGMMGGSGPFRINGSPGSMTVSEERATEIAQAWLDQHFAGDSAGTPDGFYGYYTFHFMKNDQIAGMLSVNGYSGAVWLHTWHGSFVQVRDFGE